MPIRSLYIISCFYVTHFSLCCSSCCEDACLLVWMVPFSEAEVATDAVDADRGCSPPPPAPPPATEPRDPTALPPPPALLLPPPEASAGRLLSELLEFFLSEVNLEREGGKNKANLRITLASLYTT